MGLLQIHLHRVKETGHHLSMTCILLVEFQPMTKMGLNVGGTVFWTVSVLELI